MIRIPVLARLVPASLVLAPLVLAASPAFAQETQASAAAKFSREFKASDANGDGTLSRGEVEARVGRMRVGAEHADPAVKKRLAALWFARADGDRNGKVTEAEAQRLLAATFKRYDTDRDGRIGTAERAGAKKAIQKGR